MNQESRLARLKELDKESRSILRKEITDELGLTEMKLRLDDLTKNRKELNELFYAETHTPEDVEVDVDMNTEFTRIWKNLYNYEINKFSALDIKYRERYDLHEENMKAIADLDKKIASNDSVINICKDNINSVKYILEDEGRELSDDEKELREAELEFYNSKLKKLYDKQGEYIKQREELNDKTLILWNGGLLNGKAKEVEPAKDETVKEEVKLNEEKAEEKAEEPIVPEKTKEEAEEPIVSERPKDITEEKVDNKEEKKAKEEPKEEDKEDVDSLDKDMPREEEKSESVALVPVKSSGVRVETPKNKLLKAIGLVIAGAIAFVGGILSGKYFAKKVSDKPIVDPNTTTETEAEEKTETDTAKEEIKKDNNETGPKKDNTKKEEEKINLGKGDIAVKQNSDGSVTSINSDGVKTTTDKEGNVTLNGTVDTNENKIGDNTYTQISTSSLDGNSINPNGGVDFSQATFTSEDERQAAINALTAIPEFDSIYAQELINNAGSMGENATVNDGWTLNR